MEYNVSEGHLVAKDQAPTAANDEKTQSAKNAATLVYALQAASFLVAFTYLAAVIVNYVKRSDVEGTWVSSHFRWQIRTFWFSLLWSIIGLIAIFLVIGYAILFANLVWIIYRIVKGWLYLSDEKRMN